MIVDDEPMDIRSMRNILEGTQEFDVVTANDYDEAVKLFERRGTEIQLALIDVALPGQNGVELAKRLLSSSPDLRVLFVSGHVGASVIRFYGINVSDEHFLQKPFDSARLLDRVRQALRSQGSLQLILSAWHSGSREDEPPKSSGN
jgi:two-component system, cell cycle sensor histidine kinase and response regulator CckA